MLFPLLQYLHSDGLTGQLGIWEYCPEQIWLSGRVCVCVCVYISVFLKGQMSNVTTF